MTAADLLSQSQIRWRCRRGVRELDVLLTDFLDVQYANLSQTDKQSFERLLEIQDPKIMDYLFDKDQLDDDGVNRILGLLKTQSGLS